MFLKKLFLFSEILRFNPTVLYEHDGIIDILLYIFILHLIYIENINKIINIDRRDDRVVWINTVRLNLLDRAHKIKNIIFYIYGCHTRKTKKQQLYK